MSSAVASCSVEVRAWCIERYTPGSGQRMRVSTIGKPTASASSDWHFDEALPRMERVLKVALLRRGVPLAVYVDNGQVYSSTQFHAACATLGIERIQTAPYSPQAKGKIERWFETLRAQFLPEVEASNLTTLTELNESLWAWLECVYHQHDLRQRDETGPLDPLHRWPRAGAPRGSRNGAARLSLARPRRGARCAKMRPSPCKAIAIKSNRSGPDESSNSASIPSTCRRSSSISTATVGTTHTWAWPRSSCRTGSATSPSNVLRRNHLIHPNRNRRSTI